MLSFICFVLILVGIGLAMFGALVLGSVLFGDSERAHLAREARAAERRVTEIARQAQEAILNEALQRARSHASAVRMDRTDRHTPPSADAYGPWND